MPHSTPLTRRDVLTATAAAAALAVAGPARGQAKRRKPNVLFVFSDEHRWHSMSFADMPQVKTPHMKRMAAQGVSFTHCVSNYPVCSPYRAILMTGRWPYQQGVIDNNIRLQESEVTLGEVFKRAGYATGYIGKWHLGGTRAEPHGFGLSLIWSKTNDHWNSAYHPAAGQPVKTKDYNATLMTDQALEFIDKHRREPFLLVLSLNPPHSKFTDAPKDKQALYPEGSLPYRRNVRPPKPRGKGGRRRDPWAVYKGYHAHVTAIDAELGRLLAKLNELKLADDTIVVYTSDHGSMLDSQGVGGKRQPFEESIRVPFIVRYPGVVPAGKRPDALFGAIDIMPSLCALAGLPVPETCVGLDLSPALRGERGPQPKSQFLMHISKTNASGGERHPAPIFRGVTTGRYTYAVYPDRPWCLFDNEGDPCQMKNLIDDPSKAGLRKQLRAELASWLTKANDPFKIPT